MNYETLFVDPTGRTSRAHYIGGMIALGAALTFYYFLVRGPSGRIGLLVMLFPAIVLHARRLHDMGRTAWLLILPVALIAAAAWFRSASPGTGPEPAAFLAAVVVCSGFVLWGLVGKARA